jgi:putative transcriptional regulator
MTMHQPSDEMLLDYASGALPEPVALAIATHAALCPSSRDRIETLESFGGDLIEDIEPEALSDHALDRALAAIEVPETEDPRDAVSFDAETRAIVPAPLRSYIGCNLEDVSWRRLSRVVDSAIIPSRLDDYQIRLLRIQAGHPVPTHTHRGMEITVTLQGGYFDGFSHYARGDFQLADPSLEHRPWADEDEVCLCLAVLAAPIRLTGVIGRLIDPFVRL